MREDWRNAASKAVRGRAVIWNRGEKAPYTIASELRIHCR